jgi:branched-chain amino acid transport system permease protein
MTRDKKEESVMEGGFYQLPHRISRKPLGLLLLLTFFLVVLPIIIRDKVYILHLLSMIYLNVVIILGLVLILGYTKQFSLGQVAFYGIGAYTTAVLTTNYHLSFFLALVLSGLLAGISAVFVAIPATRFQGPWLALVTFAFGEIIRILMIRLKSITGGFGGFFNIPKPRWGSFVFDDNFKFYYIFLAVMLSILAITYCLRLSPLGRIWICMGDNEDLSSSLGINNFFHKLLAFALGSFFAGIAGSLYAGYANFISPESFTLRHTIYYLSILIVGGLESISGAVAATVIFTVFSSYLMALYPWDMVIFGLIIVLFVNLIPGGLGDGFDKIRNRYQSVLGK